MEAYSSFAQVYDLFMDNVPYEEWSRYLISLLKEYQVTDGTVVELGCGTGKMTRLLADAGYDMVGVDNSAEMLEIAGERQEEEERNDILYLLQDMRELELFGNIRAIVSVCDSMNYILLINRLYSMLYMFLFVIAIIISLLLLVMGNRIHAVLVIHMPFLGKVLGRILSAKTFLVFVVLFLVFLVLYRYLPNRKASLKSQIPGAFIIAVAWSLFSYFFSLYFTFFPNFSNMYGSLSALIMVMLWLYCCMNLLLYGAEINAYFENQFRQAQITLWQMVKKNLDRFFTMWHSKKR